MAPVSEAERRRLQALYPGVRWKSAYDSLPRHRLISRLSSLAVWKPFEPNQKTALDIEMALLAGFRRRGGTPNLITKGRARAAAKIILKGRAAHAFEDQKKVFDDYKAEMASLGLAIGGDYHFNFSGQLAADILFVTGYALSPKVTSADTVMNKYSKLRSGRKTRDSQIGPYPHMMEVFKNGLIEVMPGRSADKYPVYPAQVLVMISLVPAISSYTTGYRAICALKALCGLRPSEANPQVSKKNLPTRIMDMAQLEGSPINPAGGPDQVHKLIRALRTPGVMEWHLDIGRDKGARLRSYSRTEMILIPTVDVPMIDALRLIADHLDMRNQERREHGQRELIPMDLLFAYKRTSASGSGKKYLDALKKDHPLSSHDLQNMDNMLCGLLGWQPISQHDRRRGAATAAAANGMEPWKVQQLLRHRGGRPDLLQRYVLLTEEDQQRIEVTREVANVANREVLAIADPGCLVTGLLR